MPRSSQRLIAVATTACLALAAGVVSLGDVHSAAPSFVALTLGWATAAAVGAWAVRRVPSLPISIGAAAVGLRLLLLFTEPTLSDDVYRYLWEGKVLAAGLDPFQLAPSDPALVGLRDETWARVNHRDVSTIYPPLALGLFEAVARVAPVAQAWKVLAMAADLACLALIAGLARRRGVGAWAATLWALHPLPVLESAGSGHLESLALAPLLAALWWAGTRPLWAGALATLGSLVKLLPLALLAPLWTRGPWRTRVGLALVAAVLWGLALAPWLAAGPDLARGFGRYYQAWAFNGSAFVVLAQLLGDPSLARVVGVALGAAVAGWALWRRPDPATWLLWACGALVLLSPVVHPWYLLWPLAPALIVGAWPWAVLASTVLLSYLVLGSYDPATSTWVEAWWIPWVEYPPLLVATWWWHRTRRVPSPASTGP